jgi:hypothetical protein
MNDLIKRLRQLAGIGSRASFTTATEAAALLTAMKAAGDGLAGLAHKEWCRVFDDVEYDPPCSCGLNAAIKQWREASDGL